MLETKDGPILTVVLAIIAGASCGALLRYFISNALNSRLELMPLGTLVCNLTGAFLIGLITAYLSTRLQPSAPIKLFLVTGFLGSLTTFSTFSLESVNLLLSDAPLRAIAHSLFHLLGSVFLAFTGLFIGHKLF